MAANSTVGRSKASKKAGSKKPIGKDQKKLPAKGRTGRVSTTVRQSKTKQRHCVLILGMHRSGTSAWTRVLNMLGATLPKQLLGPSEGNLAGHWEPERLVNFNDLLLKDLDSSWHDWGVLDWARFGAKQQARADESWLTLLAEDYGEADLIVVKDPRLCRFADRYIKVVEEAGYEVSILNTFRNPLDVIASLMNRSNWPLDHDKTDAAMLWLSHALAAEKAARTRTHAIVSYESLMDDPVTAAKRAVDALGTSFPIRVEQAKDEIRDFVRQDLRHHARRPEEVALDQQLAGWVAFVHAALRDLEVGRNRKGARQTLDRISSEFNSVRTILRSSADKWRIAASEASTAQSAFFDAKAEFEAERISLQRALEENVTAREKDVAQREQISASLAQKSELVDQLNAEAETLKREAGDARARFVQARAELDDLRIEVAEKGSAIEAMKIENAEDLKRIRQEFSILEASREDLLEKVDRLNKRLEHETQARKTASRLAEKQLIDLDALGHEVEAKNKIIEEANSRFDEATKSLSERDRDFKEKSRHLEVLSEELSQTHLAYRGSLSWKTTAPLRTVTSASRAAFRFTRSIPAIVRFAGGVPSTITKAIRVFRHEGMEGVRFRIRHALHAEQDATNSLQAIPDPGGADVALIQKGNIFDPHTSEPGGRSPEISIIIPVFNQYYYTAKCLESL